tara:strand:- start:2160 stop:3623 length:1464 start_codon:yes stop_codon:yes gene_type:complete
MFNIKKIFNHLIYIIIPLTYVGLQLIFLDQYPHVLVDEPWYSSTAFNIGFNGQINNSLVGWRGAEELFFYPLLLAQWFKVFGVGLIQARLFSVFVGLGIVYLFSAILQQLKVSKAIIVLSTIILVFSNTFYILARRARPEILLLFIVLVAIFLYLKYQKDKKNIFCLGLGLVLALGFWTHPNLAIMLLVVTIAFVAYQLKNKQFKPIIYLIAGESIIFGIGILGWIFFREETLIQCIQQLTQSGRVGTKTLFFSNFLGFIQTYSFGIKRAFITLFECCFLIIPIIVLKDKTTKSIAGIALIVFLGLMTFFTPFNRSMFGLFSLLSILFFGLLFEQLKVNKMLRWLMLVVGLIYFTNSFAGEIYILSKARNNTSFSKLSSYLGTIPNSDEAKVIGPIELWYALPLTNYISHNNQHLWTRYDKEQFDYIIVRDYDGDISPTALTKESIYTGYIQGYQKLNQRLIDDKRYRKQNTKNFPGFGKVSIWSKQ